MALRERLLALIVKARPELAEQPEENRAAAAIRMSITAVYLPLVAAALLWLTAVSDWTLLRENIWLFLLLTGVEVVLNERPYTFLLQFGDDRQAPIAGSLGGLLVWANVLIFGPTALWISVTAEIGRALQSGWQLSRYRGNDPVWQPLMSLVQSIGPNILSMLTAVTVFIALGGRFPLADFSWESWLPALWATLTLITLSPLLLLPTLPLVNLLMNLPNRWQGYSQLWLSIFILVTSQAPFALPVATVYTLGSPLLYLIFVGGIVLVNLLAYHLSQSNLRNQARSRDLSRLEQLGQALIQAPADASTLPQILSEKLPVLFAGHRVAVRVFDADGAGEERPWSSFTYQFPPHKPVADAADWERLRLPDEPYYIEKEVIRPGDKAPFGDIIAVPIVLDDKKQRRVGGVIIQRARTARRAEEALPTVQELAGQIGAALLRAQAQQHTTARQKMAQELAIAGRIQNTFLPAEIPHLPGWEISAALIPARQTSGDFYDFVPLADGRLGLIVADVADKGTGAALYMALSRTLIRTYAMQYPDHPERALAAANERILADTKSDQFVTVFYGVLFPAEGKLVYANAGHNPAYIVRSDVLTLRNTGIPLGMFEGMAWRQETAVLHSGDVLLMYSDGVPEAQNRAQEEFGEARLLQVVRGRDGRDAAALQQEIIDSVQSFVAGAPQFDDITLMVVQRK